MGKPGVMFYFDIRPCIKRLGYEDKGRLFEAILDYGQSGAIPEFDGVLGIAWDFIQPRLDRDTERYGQKTDKSKYAVYVREAKKHGISPLPFEEWVVTDNGKNQMVSDDTGCYPTTTSTSTTTPTSTPEKSEADKPPTHPRFSPPSVEEVAAYCREKGYAVDAERFVSYYTSNGWMVGKTPMRDWKAAVRTWERSEGRGNNSPGNRGSYTPPDDDLIEYF